MDKIISIEDLEKAFGKVKSEYPFIKGDWMVSSKGNIINTKHDYHIPSYRLEEDWISHILVKEDFDFKNFVHVYLKALKEVGVKEIKFYNSVKA